MRTSFPLLLFLALPATGALVWGSNGVTFRVGGIMHNSDAQAVQKIPHCPEWYWSQHRVRERVVVRDVVDARLIGRRRGGAGFYLLLIPPTPPPWQQQYAVSFPRDSIIVGYMLTYP